ncbi:hypothetical protein CEXT_558601 [Caerostris extrusa]|uniref:Uncharacterized protein n=1 Tax=Caerostris extrusa TaxID=172846 RepID=A0AAV4R169_CAEEX|nr:hypothetical protein CEXT_558601 [Caerostris extrusa]
MLLSFFSPHSFDVTELVFVGILGGRLLGMVGRVAGTRCHVRLVLQPQDSIDGVGRHHLATGLAAVAAVSVLLVELEESPLSLHSMLEARFDTDNCLEFVGMSDYCLVIEREMPSW